VTKSDPSWNQCEGKKCTLLVQKAKSSQVQVFSKNKILTHAYEVGNFIMGGIH
jgi:hypothetical protein